ncbi:MAG: phosphodiesterase [Clostridia bacterium]|nr:phosphodiesterase [Clostridia bacterium]
MKYIIASDIHGSSFYCKKIIEEFKKNNADKIILLGDIYNHGPRNPFPKDYAPMDVANLLNSVKNNLIVIKGNCDSQVDTLISEFDFIENMLLEVNGKSLFLSHGHIFNKDFPPKTKFDVIIYGHFHTGFIEEKDGVVFVNSGSVSLPKDGTRNSYLLLDDNVLYLKDFDDNIIDKKKI